MNKKIQHESFKFCSKPLQVSLMKPFDFKEVNQWCMDEGWNVTSLDLCWNYFGSKSNGELMQIFKAIPDRVTAALDLSWNGLASKIAVGLSEAFKVIPASVTIFHLSGNDFTEEQIKNLFTVLGSRKDVHLDFGVVKMNQELKEEIHATNMNRSLLGRLLSKTFYPASEPAQAATSSAHSLSCR